MKSKVSIGISAALLVLFVLFVVTTQSPSEKLGASINIAPVQAFSTSTSVTVTTSNTLVFATSSRTYLAITNGGPQSVWLNLTGTAATVNTGILLTASSTYEMSTEKGNPYYGAINAISAGTASSILTVTGF